MACLKQVIVEYVKKTTDLTFGIYCDSVPPTMNITTITIISYV